MGEISRESYEILKMFAQADGVVTEADIPKHFSRERLLYLEQNGYIGKDTCYRSGKDGQDIVTGEYSIRLKGREAVLLYDEADEQRAQEEASHQREKVEQDQNRKKDIRRGWVQWTITTLVALIIAFLAGSLTQWGTSFVDRLVKALNPPNQTTQDLSDRPADHPSEDGGERDIEA